MIKKETFLSTIFALSLFIFIVGISSNGVFGADNLSVSDSTPVITLDSPLNLTYTFLLGDKLTLALNVSADQQIDKWWYDLYDLDHNKIVKSNVSFSQGETFNAVRRSNKLAIYAEHAGEIGNKNVTFYVRVPNTAPVLENVPNEINVCESSALSYNLNATDADEDSLQFFVSPQVPFYVYPASVDYKQNSASSSLFSSVLTKNKVGKYFPIVSVYDGQYTDSKKINITVIEINNPPVITPIGVQTIYASGGNNVFNKQLDVHDVESGDAKTGNLSFKLNFLNGAKFFDIDKNGVMSVIGNSSVLGVYNIRVCATDKPLTHVPDKISLCGQNGGSETSCSNFSLTVTNNNKRPTITSFYPNSTELNASSVSVLSFNINTYDPDGTVPDVYWYVNGALKKYTSGNSLDAFSFAFPCGTIGKQSVRAEITDGLLNDSVLWNVALSNVSCSLSEPLPGSSGEGCAVKWACNAWQTCQNTKRSLDLGLVGGEQYKQIISQCTSLNLDDSECGMQIRSCFDAKFCNVTAEMPALVQACDYSENPSCSDHISNCHDGACELLIDCGGPCSPCSSCSDGKQDQGETGIDCGGPCLEQCPVEKPYNLLNVFDNSYFLSIILTLLLFLVIFLIWLIYKRVRERIEFENQKKMSRIFRQ